MLSDKPWRGEAVLRLLLSVFIFVMLGSLITAAIGFFMNPNHASTWSFCLLAAASALACVVAFARLIRPWNPDLLTRQLGVFLLCLYLGLVLGMFALKFSNTEATTYNAWRVTIAAMSLQGAAIFLSIPFAGEHGLTWAGAFGFGNRWPRAVVHGMVMTILFMPIGLGLQRISIAVLDWLGHETTSQTALKALEVSQGWPERLALGFVAIVLAPIAEEIIFRGILYPTIKRYGFPRLALWGTSLLFALIHASAPIFIPLLVLALALTLLYEMTDNLLAPIVAHSLFNAINFAMFFLSDSLNHWLKLHS